MRSNRRKAVIRWLLGLALAGVIILPFVDQAVESGSIGWWEAAGSGYFIVLSGLHRITDTQTVNNWLVKIDLGKDDIRSLRKKAQDRRDERRRLDEPPYSGSNYRYDGKTGQYIDRDHQRIAEIVNDYDPALFLCWVPPDKRVPGDTQTYALVLQRVGQKEVVVKTFSDDQIDERVLSWVFRADTRRTDVLTEMDAQNKAAELVEARKWEDTRAEMRDFLHSVLKTPKHTYRHKGKDWLDDKSLYPGRD